MKNKLRNYHGFTLVELLVTLSLTAMVIAILGSFFVNHLRSYHQAIDDVAIQDQAKAAMNLVMEKAMETKGINALSLLNDNPYIVKFEEVDGTLLIFSYDPTHHQLKWGITTASNTVAGEVTKFEIKPSTNNGTSVILSDLSQASMAQITITVTGTNSGIPGPPPKVVTLNNSLRFRNYVGP